MATEKEEFRFDYKRFEPKGITVEKLDQAFESFMAPTVTLWSQIILLIKIVAFSLYLWTRRGLVNNEMLIEKQEYERKRNQSQRGDLEEDDLD